MDNTYSTNIPPVYKICRNILQT